MFKAHRHLISTVAAAAVAFGTTTAHACTSFLLKAENGDVVYGRTLEFALMLHSQVIVVPRGYENHGVGPDGKAGGGLVYKARYAATGMNALNLPVVVDGINEKGLAAGMFFFPSLAKFQEVSPNEAPNSVASYELVNYILTQFATVDEVKAGIQKIKVSNAELSVFNGPAPVHFSVHDAAGNTIAIEYINGQLQVTDNPTSVMTNAPGIEWHLASLSMFATSTPAPVPPFTINGKSFPQWSTGGGQVAQPGDYSSQSRFIRAAFLVASAPKFKDAAAGMPLAFHLLNQFDIPPGAIQTTAGGSAGGGVAGYEITEWTSSADLKHGIYRFRTYDNPALRQVSLGGLDLNAKQIRYIPINQPAMVTDLSK
ncbi:MAG: choloylglycine hydrolase family protein [Verrucomicrobiota bacterium]